MAWFRNNGHRRTMPVIKYCRMREETVVNTVLIANTAEAFEGLLQRSSHTEEGSRRMRHELALSQRAFFWGGDDKLVITPYAIPQALMRHNMAACGFSNIINRWPIEPTIALSKAVEENNVLVNVIIEYARKNPAMRISPYVITDNFLSLLDRINAGGTEVVADEKPREHSLWTIKYLDSKVGFRAEMQKLATERAEVRIPEGFLAGNKREAVDIAAWFYAHGRAVVVKVNYGESGWGLWIARLNEYSSASHLRETLETVFSLDPIWEDSLIVVEEFVEPDTRVAGGSPSTELFVSESGPFITYHCGQLLNANGGFFGVEIGRGVLSASVRDTLERTSRIIGERYHELGYRGFFDIDFVASRARDGTIYVVETNTRRTGGTHVYDLAKYLFGDTWETDTYLLSHDSLGYGNELVSVETLLKQIQSLLYPISSQRKGVIVTSVNAWDPVFGYVIVAPDADEGKRLQQELFNLFGIAE